MRIAISGTHSVGKTTLIEEFMRRHPEFVYEAEPYTVLVEDYGEEFSSEPTVDDFYRQLEFNVDRLRHHKDDGMVIYERCPADFLAYILALKDLNTEGVDSAFVEKLLGMVLDAIQHLDLIIFLPLDEAKKPDLPDAEYPRLQRNVDSLLVDIFSGDEFGIVSSGNVVVLEARGSTTQRLEVLEEAIESAS
jgi:GTPase SAR1 family protein